MLVDFGRQVGVENRAKIDPKRHRTNDGKMTGTKIAKKSKSDSPSRPGTGFPGPRGGGMGRGKPLPREGGKGVGTVEHSKPPSRGWWDLQHASSIIHHASSIITYKPNNNKRRLPRGPRGSQGMPGIPGIPGLCYAVNRA